MKIYACLIFILSKNKAPFYLFYNTIKDKGVNDCLNKITSLKVKIFLNYSYEIILCFKDKIKFLLISNSNLE